MKITCTVSDRMKQIQKKLKALPQNYGDAVKDRAIELTEGHVRSGELISSYVVEIDGMTVTIGNTSQHAEYLEFGTVHIDAVGMLSIPVAESPQIIDRILKE